MSQYNFAPSGCDRLKRCQRSTATPKPLPFSPGQCSPDVTLTVNLEQEGATREYLVRPREGRISTMKIKNM